MSIRQSESTFVKRSLGVHFKVHRGVVDFKSGIYDVAVFTSVSFWASSRSALISARASFTALGCYLYE